LGSGSRLVVKHSAPRCKMRLRCFVILALFPSGSARRSFRILDSRHDAQQQDIAFTSGLEVSAEARGAFIPGVFGARTFPGAGLQFGALRERYGQVGRRAGHLEAHRVAPIKMAGPNLPAAKVAVRLEPKSAVAIDIEVPSELANEMHMQVVKDLGKKVHVPGFRDGKAPPSAIVNAVGPQKVKKRTVEQIVDVMTKQSSSQVKLHTIGQARLSEEVDHLASRYKIGDSIDFTVMVDVYPNLELNESTYTGLEVEVEEVPFNQDAYDAALRKLRDQHADLVDKEPGSAAEEGDELLINMEGFVANDDGSKAERLPAVAGGDAISLRLKPGVFMPGLVEGLIGVKAGETRDIAVRFPARSSVPELAGKAAIFEVECLKVQSRVLPELTDEFANKVKSDTTWEELDALLRDGVNEEMAEKQQQETHQELQKVLVEVLPKSFEVPMTLTEQVTKERFAMMLSDMRERGSPDEKLKELVTPENYERYSKISESMSANQVKADLAIQKIAEQQGLKVKPDDVDDEVMTLQRSALQRGEKFKESEVRPRVEAQLFKDMVLSWLEARSNIKLVREKQVDATEILGISPEELAEKVAADEAAKKAAPP